MNPKLAIGVAILLCFVSGCYERTTHGSESIYRFAWWLLPTFMVIGIFGIPIGWRFRKSQGGFVVLFMSTFFLFLICPSMYLDRILIDNEHFEASHGFWFYPTDHQIRFSELREIRYVKFRDNRGVDRLEFHCIYQNGAVKVINLGDLLRNADEEILQRATSKGVRVVR